MPRKGSVPRRAIEQDPVYGSELAARFINKLMWDGKKTLAQGIFYDALARASEKSGKEPLELFDAALKNVMPQLEVRARRVGGATYQVPVEVRPERRLALGMRWLVQFARQRNERTMVERLAAELLDAVNGVGASVKRREEMHRMAEANKAFAHYRW